MDWNIFFESPGFAVVTNQIFGLLDIKSIMVCRKVSPVWKTYIDEQRVGRVCQLLSLMEKYAKINDELFRKKWNRHCGTKQTFWSFGEKFPRWNKIIPYIETEMSVSDMDKLIATELYTNSVVYDREDWESKLEYYQVWYWCPLHWAIHFGNLEFVEVMSRTPFNFNTLIFILKDNIEICSKCKKRREEEDDDDFDFWELPELPNHDAYVCPCATCKRRRDGNRYSDDNNVLHKAARNGDIQIIKLILKEKKVNTNAKNSFNQSALVTAKDDPEVVKLLMKHCKYTESDVTRLGRNTLAFMAKSFLEKDEPPKRKNAKKAAKK